MAPDRNAWEKAALTREEYDLVVAQLEREPTQTELGIFRALWDHLGTFALPQVLLSSDQEPTSTPPTRDGLGAIELGEGLTLAMAIEPLGELEIALLLSRPVTCFRGVLRKLFTKSVRPFAILNSFCFGGLNDAANRRLLSDVVSDIAACSRAMGVSDVTASVFSADYYTTSPLIGLIGLGTLQSGYSSRAVVEPGDELLLADVENGGACPCAVTFPDAERQAAPATDRFAVPTAESACAERRLLEACLDLRQTDSVADIRDLRGVGLGPAVAQLAVREGFGTTVKLSATGGTGIEDDLSAEAGRSQENRVLIVVKAGKAEQVKAVFERWNLSASIVGQVTDEPIVRARNGEVIVAEIPTGVLAKLPVRAFSIDKPAWLERLQDFDLDQLLDITNGEADPHRSGYRPRPIGASRSANRLLLSLLASPNVASKASGFSRRQSLMEDSGARPAEGEVAILAVPNSAEEIAVNAAAKGRQCYLDPFMGGAIAVAEAARSLVCAGAQPLGLACHLTLGYSERADADYYLVEAAKGVVRAASQLGISLIDQCVNLHHEVAMPNTYPTPIVGMVGRVENSAKRCESGFRDEGDLVVLLGGSPRRLAGDEERRASARTRLGASEYLQIVHGLVAGQPAIDLDLEARLQHCCLSAIRQGLVKSACSCADGGLVVALALCSIAGQKGFRDWAFAADGRVDAILFGEEQSRIILSIDPGDLRKLIDLAEQHRVSIRKLGVVTGERLIVEGYLDLPVSRLAEVARAAWEPALQV